MNKAIKDIASEYRRYAVEHGKATHTGDHKKANKYHGLLIEALLVLRQHGAEGDRALVALLSDEDASVKCWAGTHCLKVDETQARLALESVASGPGIEGFNARMVLSEWKKGALTVP